MLYEIIFSPTGGTSNVSRKLSAAWDGEKKEIDLFRRDYENKLPELTDCDVCIISAPVYSGRIPSAAAERLKLIKGCGAKAVAVTVYGNCKIGDAMAEMEDILDGCGFRVIAGISAVAEHSLIRSIAAKRPDAADAEALENFGRQITAKINSGDLSKPVLPGNRPYKPYGHGLHPYVRSGCINCGICARECPADAISFGGNWVTDPEKCISCMHCVRFCPQSYRILDPKQLEALSERLAPIAAERQEDRLYI